MKTEYGATIIEVRDLMEMLARFEPTDHVRVEFREVLDEEGIDATELFVSEVKRTDDGVSIIAQELL